MFDGWQTFYQMTAEAAATLTGLLFIVATLTAGRQTSAVNQGARLFTGPTVFHLASVLAVSAVALAPDGEAPSPGLIMTLWTLAGLVYATTIAIGLRGLENPTHWTDFWWYGAAPAATYLALTIANALALAHTRHAAYSVALGLLVLLLIAIRNAWDLATWLATRRDEAQAVGSPARGEDVFDALEQEVAGRDAGGHGPGAAQETAEPAVRPERA
jgi:hypothetical protein